MLNLVGGNPFWAGIKARGRECALSALKPQEPTGGRSLLRRLSGKNLPMWSGHRNALPSENVTRELGAHKRSGSMQPLGHRFYTTMP